MKLKYKFVLSATPYLQYKNRLLQYSILATIFLLSVIISSFTKQITIAIFSIFSSIIFIIYNLLISLYDDIKFQIIYATNDEEASMRKILLKNSKGTIF